MAKVLKELYGVVGKIGNKTYYESGGETLVREIVTPKNPKSVAQTLQRVIIKVVGMAYAKLKELCNHSFEGCSYGAKCSEYFRGVNTRYLRERASYLQNSGQSLNQFFQFLPIESEKWSPFAAIVSQGHLPEVSVTIDAEGGHVACVNFVVTIRSLSSQSRRLMASTRWNSPVSCSIPVTLTAVVLL